MANRLRRLSVALLIALFLVVTLAPGRVLAGGSIGPRQMLITYYDQINMGNYMAAYQRWVVPPHAYGNFVAGYADTASVTVYFGGFQASAPGGTDGRVPGILISTHWDGTQTAYSGCYAVRYNDDATGFGQWSITGGAFNRMSFVPISGARDDGGIGDLLGNIQCLSRYNADGSYTTVQNMLVDYFDAINRGKYERAYSFWANPRQNFQDFANGWMTTIETVMFYGNYQSSRNPVSAETGRVPVVLMGYHTDGSLVAYQGCIGVNYNTAAAPQWRIWDAYLSPLAFTATPSDAQVAAALNASCY